MSCNAGEVTERLEKVAEDNIKMDLREVVCVAG